MRKRLPDAARAARALRDHQAPSRGRSRRSGATESRTTVGRSPGEIFAAVAGPARVPSALRSRPRSVGRRSRPARVRHGVSDPQGQGVLEARRLKVTYDGRTDTLTVLFKEGAANAESDEERPGVIFDCDERCELVSLEFVDASNRITEPRRVEFQATTCPALARCGIAYSRNGASFTKSPNAAQRAMNAARPPGTARASALQHVVRWRFIARRG